jgi:hypothetical protein
MSVPRRGIDYPRAMSMAHRPLSFAAALALVSVAGCATLVGHSAPSRVLRGQRFESLFLASSNA